jgi:hypothetical protein
VTEHSADYVRPQVAAWAQEVRLIVARGTCGRGIDGDPVRTIYHLFTPSGELIAHFDPWAASGIATAGLQGLMSDG